MKKQKTLKDYCDKKKITLEDLAKITGVSVSQIYLIAKNPNYNITIGTAQKIYTGTKNKFGKGLGVWDYITFKK